MMRRFEFVGGTSAKFYEVVVAGSSVNVRYTNENRSREVVQLSTTVAGAGQK